MFYSPHILYKRVVTDERDEFNRPTRKSEEWVEVGACRCDDNTTQKFDEDNERVFRPKYKIVASRNVDVTEGDTIKVEPNRGEGVVYMVKHLNYLDYSEIWV